MAETREPKRIPEEAVRAAALAIGREYESLREWDREAFARAALEAAAPVLAAQAQREMAEQIRSIAHDDEQWGFVNFRAFIKRHKRLVQGSSGIAILLAVADEIEGDARAEDQPA
ncbi:hypothetical protein ACWEJ6_21115 [Nonomuraea sp. NPDC004702]